MPRLLQISQLGHPILREKAIKIDDPTAPHIQDLIDDMIATVADANGVGVAAPQVYESKRLIIVASRPNQRYPYAPLMEPTAMINPEILEMSEEKIKDWEGCLSIPGVRGLVPRAKSVRLRYLTRKGEQVEGEFSDFIARIVLHEVDHLDGIMFLERMDSLKEIVTDKKFLKIIAERTKACG